MHNFNGILQDDSGSLFQSDIPSIDASLGDLVSGIAATTSDVSATASIASGAASFKCLGRRGTRNVDGAAGMLSLILLSVA